MAQASASEVKVAEMEQSIEEIHRELKVFSDGCKLLVSSGNEMEKKIDESFQRMELWEKRFDMMEKHMFKLSEAVERIESNQTKEKPNGKSIASSSHIDIEAQVQHPNPMVQPENNLLGYRGLGVVLENRENLLRKIELPVFDGSRPYGWIFRVERYFRVGQYTEEQKLELISLSLEGKVLNWFEGEFTEQRFIDWSDFKERMLARFAVSIDDEPGKRLCSITQTGSVQDYISEFEELRAQVTGIDEKNLVNIFYKGLKKEMKEIIKLKEPKGLTAHKAAVVKMEDSLLCQALSAVKTGANKQQRSYTYTPFKAATVPQKQLPDTKEQQGSRQQFRPRLHLSEEELK